MLYCSRCNPYGSCHTLRDIHIPFTLALALQRSSCFRPMSHFERRAREIHISYVKCTKPTKTHSRFPQDQHDSVSRTCVVVFVQVVKDGFRFLTGKNGIVYLVFLRYLWYPNKFVQSLRNTLVAFTFSDESPNCSNVISSSYWFHLAETELFILRYSRLSTSRMSLTP